MDRAMSFAVGVRVGDEDGTVGVLVPDVPNSARRCRTLDEALAHARGAIERHIEIVLERNATVLRPVRTIEALAGEPNHDGLVWMTIEIDVEGIHRRHAQRLRAAAFERFESRSRGTRTDR
jgi:predicted RNase H-like HicB family nuclease